MEPKNLFEAKANSRPSASSVISSRQEVVIHTPSPKVRFCPADDISANALPGPSRITPTSSLGSSPLERFRYVPKSRRPGPFLPTPSPSSRPTSLALGKKRSVVVEIPKRPPFSGSPLSTSSANLKSPATKSTAISTQAGTFLASRSPTDRAAQSNFAWRTLSPDSQESRSVERALIKAEETLPPPQTPSPGEQPMTPPTTPSKAGPSRATRGHSPSPVTPTKRRRTTRESSNYWESDRKVLIHAEATTFKLSPTRLKKLSGWFRDELTRLSDEEPEINLDETGVSASDFESLLNALDKFWLMVFCFSFSFKVNGFDSTYDESPPPFEDIITILRAARLLRFENEAAWAIRRIKALWSDRLSDITVNHRPQAIEAIAIAREYGINAILRPAFYELMRGASTPEVIENHIKDGRFTVKDAMLLMKAKDEATAQWLSVATAHRILRNFPSCKDAEGAQAPPHNTIHKVPSQLGRAGSSGINRVTMLKMKFEGRDVDSEPAPTQAHKECISGDITLFHRAHTKLVDASGMLQRYRCDPVFGLQALLDAPWAKEGLCEKCVNTRKEGWQAERERIWDEIGVWFGVNEPGLVI
ncbi:hypothetical protein H0H87_008641 [Tephrocybe sp. NHM501043]|nr:hypothetical protein H0H87_008641 [Tephrocybe sp. NHM501043]